MCGIAGIISSDTSCIYKERLQKMADALAHRGPDGEAWWINHKGNAGFAHRRLAIIDLSNTGNQPMHYADRYTIVYNGEIYNYVELKDALIKKGYSFRSSCDTEVILAAYACYGENCLALFDGMFAFAIWDEQEQTLFAARDRFGEKPFYYYHNGHQLLFASEMKALWSAGIEKVQNKTLLYNFLTLGYTSDPADLFETFYTNISKLPAAFSLKYNAVTKALETTRYWDIDSMNKTVISDKEAMEQFKHLLVSSVQKRLRSDVQTGTSLSGGLDSSSIIAILCNDLHKGEKMQTFSATFPLFEKDESAFQQEVVKRFKLINHTVSPTADDLVNSLSKLNYHQEEPFQSSSIFAQFKVFELAAQHNTTVLLDGQGADETLAGYNKYHHWYLEELYIKDKKLFREEKRANPDTAWNWRNTLIARFPAVTSGYIERIKAIQQKKNRDLTKDFINNFGHSFYHYPQPGSLNSVLYYNTSINGLEELLRYADRNSMAHGREVRLPFLQYELVQFIFSLPAHFKIRNGFSKWILRQSMDGCLPASIVWRKDKTGFEPPQQQWMEHKMVKEYIHEAKRLLVKQGILTAEALDKPIRPAAAHEAENYDWRFLSAAVIF